METDLVATTMPAMILSAGITVGVGTIQDPGTATTGQDIIRATGTVTKMVSTMDFMAMPIILTTSTAMITPLTTMARGQHWHPIIRSEMVEERFRSCMKAVLWATLHPMMFTLEKARSLITALTTIILRKEEILQTAPEAVWVKTKTCLPEKSGMLKRPLKPDEQKVIHAMSSNPLKERQSKILKQQNLQGVNHR